jgi:hypothetical protein
MIRMTNTALRNLLLCTTSASLLAGCAWFQSAPRVATAAPAAVTNSGPVVPVSATVNDATSAAAQLSFAQGQVTGGNFAEAELAFAAAKAAGADAELADVGSALAKLGQGDEAGARTALLALAGQRLTGQSARSNLGLGLALVGETDAAIAMLTPLADSIDATPRIRQNLAFAHAIAGNRAAAIGWARVDLDGVSAVRRVAGWDSFRAKSAPVRLAALLGVTPMVAPPVAQPAPKVAALITSDTADAAPVLKSPEPASAPPLVPIRIAPNAVDEPVAAPKVQTVSAVAAPVASPATTATSPRITPAVVEGAAAAAAAAVATPNGNTTRGIRWVVQVAAVPAQEVATRQTKISARLGDLPAQWGGFATSPGPKGLTRLNVGPFPREADAAGACRTVKAKKLDCFVRRAS